MQNKTVFVLLAGGKSQRMGVAKGLLKYQQTFWILAQLNRIAKGNIKTVFIGLGHNYKQYFTAIPWLKEALLNTVDFCGLKVSVVINTKPEMGPFSTLQTVLKQIKTPCHILANPIDVPVPNATTLNKICTVQNAVAIPTYIGKNGHPIQLHFSFWQQLLHVNNTDENARLDFQIKNLTSKKISKIAVDDSCILKNLNTPEAWHSFLNFEKNLS